MTTLFEGLAIEDVAEWQLVIDSSVLSRMRELDENGLPWRFIGLDAASRIVRSNPAALREYLPPLARGTVLNATLGVRFWRAFLQEWFLLFCTGDKKYTDIRGQFAKEQKKTSAVMIGIISGAVGGHLGIEAGLITPLVLVGLQAAVLLGKETVCKLAAQELAGAGHE